MRFASAEHFGIDPRKLVVFAVASAAVAAVSFPLVAGEVLGVATGDVQLVLAGLVFYLVFTTPKRMLSSVALSQSRDAVLLSVIARACLTVSGSRARTLIMLDSRDPEISNALKLAKRRVLLGWGTGASLKFVSGGLASYSASNVLKGMAELPPRTISERGEESEGIADSSQLSQETKLPVFMTACFFTPILLLLYAVFSHVSAPGRLAEVLAIEVILLDVAFYMCSSRRNEPR